MAVFPDLPSPSLEDFTNRTAESWRVGRKDWDNGAVFFVFVNDRKMRIETGYGLEGALPDILAARILDEQVVPRFRKGDFAGGLEAGIDGILAATRGEYTAPPPQAAGRARRRPSHHRPLRDPLLLAGLPGRPERPRGPHLQPPGLAPRLRATGAAAPGGRRRAGRAAVEGAGAGAAAGGFSGGGGSFGGGGASSSW